MDHLFLQNVVWDLCYNVPDYLVADTLELHFRDRNRQIFDFLLELEAQQEYLQDETILRFSKYLYKKNSEYVLYMLSQTSRK